MKPLNFLFMPPELLFLGFWDTGWAGFYMKNILAEKRDLKTALKMDIKINLKNRPYLAKLKI